MERLIKLIDRLSWFLFCLVIFLAGFVITNQVCNWIGV